MSDGPHPNPNPLPLADGAAGADRSETAEFRPAAEAEGDAPTDAEASADDAGMDADADRPDRDADREETAPEAAPVAAPLAEEIAEVAPSGPFGSFVAGTRLATADGPMAVEALSVGTLLVTAGGQQRPIRWIGARTVSCHGHTALQPVRIAAQAFGENRPERDLLVAPGHGLCFDVLGEVLIPAERLVNSTTLARIPLESVTYWHVELAGHDLLLAEGQPVESCRDTGHRHLFTPAGEDPAARSEPALRLADRARALGWQLAEASLAGLHLVVDGQRIEPDADGLVVRFVLPTEAQDVRLVSHTSVPAYVLPNSTDDRRLGVALADVTIDDGLTGQRRIDLDDPRLGAGFHPTDGQGDGEGDGGGVARWRWTDGGAVLPASLWEGCRGIVFLRIVLSCPALPRWIGPREAAGIVELAGFRRPQ